MRHAPQSSRTRLAAQLILPPSASAPTAQHTMGLCACAPRAGELVAEVGRANGDHGRRDLDKTSARPRTCKLSLLSGAPDFAAHSVAAYRHSARQTPFAPRPGQRTSTARRFQQRTSGSDRPLGGCRFHPILVHTFPAFEDATAASMKRMPAKPSWTVG